ncbi:MAG: helix-turn-helix domain-containing protein [Clostridiales bacterium]|nr:helix-turn-helix domain-containing protein [Clostridiales bacterium]
MTLGEQIKSKRKEKGLSQKELGSLLGVSGSMIGQYENNIRKPKMETLYRILQALDVTWVELAGSGAGALELSMGEEAWHNLNNETDIERGIIAILSKLYGFAECKEVAGEYGSCVYFLIGKGEKSFVLYDGDIKKIQNFIEKSLPSLVEIMADKRPENEIISEIEEELKDPALKKIADNMNTACDYIEKVLQTRYKKKED